MLPIQYWFSIGLVWTLDDFIVNFCPNRVGLQRVEYLWNHGNMFETGVFEIMSVSHSTMSGGEIEISSRFLFNIRVYCMF